MNTELAHVLHEADQREIDRLRHENELLLERIGNLLAEAKSRPSKQQCDYVAEFAKEQSALYRAALARCKVLSKKLREAQGG